MQRESSDVPAIELIQNYTFLKAPLTLLVILNIFFQISQKKILN